MRKRLIKEHKNVIDKIKPILEKGKFYLAGGTALYYYLNHRKSLDLDFFTNESFDLRDLKLYFNPDELKVISKETIHSKVSDINISFFFFPYPLIKKLVKFNSIYLASIEDILCMKVNAIISRGSRKDFIDVYFIMKYYKINSKKVIKLFKRKFGSFDELMIKKAMVFFKDAEKEPAFPLIKKVDWEAIKSFMVKEFVKL